MRLKLIFLSLLMFSLGCGFASAEIVPDPALKSRLEITANNSATARRIMQQAANEVQLAAAAKEQRKEQLLPSTCVNPATAKKIDCDKTGVRSRLHRRQRNWFGPSGIQQGQGLRRGHGQGHGRGRH